MPSAIPPSAGLQSASCFGADSPGRVCLFDFNGPQDGLRVIGLFRRFAHQPQHLFRRQGGEDHPHAPLPVLLPIPHGNPAHRTDVYPVGGESNPPKLAVGVFRVGEPLLDAGGQLFRPMPGAILAMQVVSSLQQPVDVLYRSTACINPQDGAPPPGFAQFQDGFGGFYQRLQGLRQRLIAGEDLLHHHFLNKEWPKRIRPDAPSNSVVG